MRKWIFAVCILTALFISYEVNYFMKIKSKKFGYTCYTPDHRIMLSSVGTGLEISRLRKNTIIDEQTGELVILNDNCVVTEVKY